MKLLGSPRISTPRVVAPHWGAWIEISIIFRHWTRRIVAPHWGAWIEIVIQNGAPYSGGASHPTGVRGLKY